MEIEVRRATAITPIAPAGALATIDELRGFIDVWLENRELTPATRAGYRYDVLQYLDWCAGSGHDPFAVRFTHLNAYSRYLQHAVDHRDEPSYTASTRARKLSAISSWYRYLVKIGVLAANPAVDIDRPKVDRDHSSTVAFTTTDARAIVAAGEKDGPLGGACATALLDFLVNIGARVSEVCAVDIVHLTFSAGHRVVELKKMKGGKERTRAVPPSLGAAIDAYLLERARRTGVRVDQLAGPLFVTRDDARVDRHTVYRLVRRAARAAGLPNADRITPHSFRHAWNTIAKQAGATIERRQRALGHVALRTTQRYDRSVEDLNTDPSYLVAIAVAGSAE